MRIHNFKKILTFTHFRNIIFVANTSKIYYLASARKAVLFDHNDLGGQYET